MRAVAVALVVVAVHAAAHADPLVLAPASVDLGSVHERAVKTFVVRITNAGTGTADHVTCRGHGFRFTPATVTIAPGATADVTATYTEVAKLSVLGRLAGEIACGGAQLIIAGVRWPRPRVDDYPIDAPSLAAAIASGSSGWGGIAYSASRGLVNGESCGSPMTGDPDACCTLWLGDLGGARQTSFVRAARGCTRAGARSPADLARELALTFARDGWIALDSESWMADARVLDDGRVLEWHDGAVWLGDRKLAAMVDQPALIAFSRDFKVVLARGRAGWVPIPMPPR